MKYLTRILLATISLSLGSALGSTVMAKDVYYPPNVYTYEDGSGFWGVKSLPEPDEGQTLVSYTITPSYCIEIPATITFAANETQADGTVTLFPHPKLPSGGNEIHVSPSSDSSYRLANGVADSVDYEFGTTASETYDTTDDPDYFSGASDAQTAYLAFVTDGTDADQQDQTVVANIDNYDVFKFSGAYTDAVIWTITVPAAPAVK
ncbi:MAG: hypothetical protein LBT80_00070 [Lactobacillaceae bacterium]|jgi:hypothetical protein|nr:hypothetical protein [Lactobacillaceae bacterium]